jgi:hypothetical protein
MSRFLLGTIPVVGQVSPMLPIARRLVERGHEVWWYRGKLFEPPLETLHPPAWWSDLQQDKPVIHPSTNNQTPSTLPPIFFARCL